MNKPMTKNAKIYAVIAFVAILGAGYGVLSPLRQ